MCGNKSKIYFEYILELNSEVYVTGNYQTLNKNHPNIAEWMEKAPELEQYINDDKVNILSSQNLPGQYPFLLSTHLEEQAISARSNLSLGLIIYIFIMGIFFLAI